MSLQGKTVIIPVVSTANLAQLAVDLLIATLGLQFIRQLKWENCIPVVGAREDGLPGLTTPMELYGRSDLDFVVIQQRSPALRHREKEFVDDLLDLITSEKLGAVLLVSGLDPINRTDAQMAFPLFKVVPSNTASSLPESQLQTLLNLPIPDYILSNAKTVNGIPPLEGGDLTQRILTSLPEDWATPIAALVQYVIEGDNRSDAHLLASVIARGMGLDEASLQWKEPGSWKHGLFGTPHDQVLYG